MTVSGVLGLLGIATFVVAFFVGGGSDLAERLPPRFALLGLFGVPVLAIVFLSAALIGAFTGWY